MQKRFICSFVIDNSDFVVILCFVVAPSVSANQRHPAPPKSHPKLPHPSSLACRPNQCRIAPYTIDMRWKAFRAGVLGSKDDQSEVNAGIFSSCKILPITWVHAGVCANGKFAHRFAFSRWLV